jgi:phage tail-like protein
VLKRGLFKGDNEYFEWMNTISMNKVERRDITISLMDETHVAVIAWKLKNAWPLKIQSTDLKSQANEIAIESLTVSHEGMEIMHV